MKLILRAILLLLCGLLILIPAAKVHATSIVLANNGCINNGGDTTCFPVIPGMQYDLNQIKQSVANSDSWNDAAIYAMTGNVTMSLFQNDGSYAMTIGPNQEILDMGQYRNKIRYVSVSYSWNATNNGSSLEKAPNDTGCINNGGDTTCFPVIPGMQYDLRQIQQSLSNPDSWDRAATFVTTGDVEMQLFSAKGKYLSTVEPNQPLTSLGKLSNKVRYISLAYAN